MGIYSSLRGHHSMFFDDPRNKFYAEAIDKVITQESVVLDLGAGLGLHGLMAIESGAKKTYLVEPASIIEMTRQVVEANNLAEKVECIRGAIEEVELPEQVDCIISVLTGNFLLTEDLLPSLFYARDNFLRPGGKLIPNRAKMEVVPVSAEDYYAKYIDCWDSVDSTKLSYHVIRRFAVNEPYYGKPEERETDFLADSVVLLDLDFMTATKADCRCEVEAKITKDGLCHGLLGWFQAQIGEQWMSTSPLEEQLHWRQVFFPLSQPVEVKKGEHMRLELYRPEFGEWAWSVDVANTHLRQSSFNANVVAPKDLLRRTNDYKGKLSTKGRASLDVLKQLDGTKSTSSIADSLIESYPQLFKTRQLAEQFVKSHIQHFG